MTGKLLKYMFALLLSVQAAAAENLLQDGGFEKPGNGTETKYSSRLFSEWIIRFNGRENGEGSRVDGKAVREGKYALRLVNKSPRQITTADALKVIKVSPGEEVTAQVSVRGKGGAHVHFYYLDANGKKTGKYFGDGCPARPEWKVFQTRFTVPQGVSGVIFSLWAIRNADIVFDDARVCISRNNLLDNSKLKATVNFRTGGVIDSLICKNRPFDYTVKSSLQFAGGLFADILPARSMPGYFRNSNYELNSDGSGRKIVLTRNEPSQGIRIKKTFTLNGEDPAIHAEIQITNTLKKEQKVEYRLQNVINFQEGVFSWPGPDWLVAFRWTGNHPGTMNSIHVPLIRSGWIAKKFEQEKQVMLFTFDPSAAERCYTFLGEGFATMEWYYRSRVLQPGESLTLKCALRLEPSEAPLYADAVGKTQKVEYIVPKALPPPKMKKELPAQIKTFFPFMASTGIPLPQAAGSGLSGSTREKNYPVTAARTVDDLAWNYFNSVYSPLILADQWSSHLWQNGKNQLCEQLLRRDMKLTPTWLMLNRNHVDVKKYRLNTESRRKSPYFQELWKKYADLIPCVFTADEIEGKNVDVMLKAHDALAAMVPHDCLLFPYVCAGNTELIPYVPVFLCDWYPINRRGFRGRDPWSVKRTFENIVAKAGETPVWFMPQGFGCLPPSSYAFPSAGEIRLMIHLAVAVGVKGIVFHGFPNTGWNWVNGKYYDYSFYGAGGQKTPQWEALGSCAKTLTAIGSLVCRTVPGKPPADFRIQSPEYRSANGFYEGKQVILQALDGKNFQIIVCINMDPEKKISFPLDFGKNRVYDLRSMAPAEKMLALEGGDAAYFLLNGSTREIREVFRNRCIREKARLTVLQEIAAAQKLEIVPLDADWEHSPETAFGKIVDSIEKQKKILLDSSVGKICRQMQRAEKVLDQADFLLSRYGRIFKTRKSAETDQLVQTFSRHFFELNRLRIELRKGFSEASAPRAENLAIQVECDFTDLRSKMKKFDAPEEPDDPML